MFVFPYILLLRKLESGRGDSGMKECQPEALTMTVIEIEGHDNFSYTMFYSLNFLWDMAN